jgi:anti-sigma B factor antagonist
MLALMDLLRIATFDGDPVVVTLSGELDLGSAVRLADQLQALLLAGQTRVVVDLEHLIFCDSTGISTFVRANQGYVDRGGYLRLAAPNPNVARVLGVVGLLDTFPTYQTVDGARAADDGALVVRDDE